MSNQDGFCFRETASYECNDCGLRIGEVCAFWLTEMNSDDHKYGRCPDCEGVLYTQTYFDENDNEYDSGDEPCCVVHCPGESKRLLEQAHKRLDVLIKRRV